MLEYHCILQGRNWRRELTTVSLEKAIDFLRRYPAAYLEVKTTVEKESYD